MVLAFLQNLWVKDPERVKTLLDAHAGDIKYRGQLIRQLLFAGCVTGRRIRQAFGGMVEWIAFEEVTDEIAGDSRTICKPNPEHIKKVYEHYHPRVVITFGAVAKDAIGCLKLDKTITVINAPHPASRQADIMAQLNAVAKRVATL